MFKKNIGLIGFLIAVVGVSIAAVSKYLYDDDLNPLFQISLLCWITALIIGSELNKPQPKNLYILVFCSVNYFTLFVAISLSYVYFFHSLNFLR